MAHDTRRVCLETETSYCCVCMTNVPASDLQGCGHGECRGRLCDSDQQNWVRSLLQKHALAKNSFVFMTDAVAASMFTCPFCRRSPEALVKHTGFCLLPDGTSSLICSFTFRGKEVAGALLSVGGIEEVVRIASTPTHPTSAQYRIVPRRSVTVVGAAVDPMMQGWRPEISWSTSIPSARKKDAPIAEASFAAYTEALIAATTVLRAAATDEERRAACEAVAAVQSRFDAASEAERRAALVD